MTKRKTRCTGDGSGTRVVLSMWLREDSEFRAVFTVSASVLLFRLADTVGRPLRKQSVHGPYQYGCDRAGGSVTSQSDPCLQRELAKCTSKIRVIFMGSDPVRLRLGVGIHMSLLLAALALLIPSAAGLVNAVHPVAARQLGPPRARGPLIDWATRHGAWISDSVEIRPTTYGGRGLFTTADIDAGTELFRLPGHLQLGVPQLAEGADAELQAFARSLPPNNLRFLPCAVALCGEMRRGNASLFDVYINELPATYTNAIAPCCDGDGYSSESGERFDAPSGLAWAPGMAALAATRRRALRELHTCSAPQSLPLADLCWASAAVCSRSLTRRRVRALTDDELSLIGEYASRDHARLLPIIDLVNHAIPSSGANVDVRHQPRQRRGVRRLLGKEDRTDQVPGQVSSAQRQSGSNPTAVDAASDRLSTSLITTRTVPAGRELLLDYANGIYGDGRLPDQKVLLDFGFVPPLSDQPGYPATLQLEPHLPPSTVATDEAKYFRFLVSGARKAVEPGPLRFSAAGEPSLATLALALAFSFSGPEELARLVKIHEASPEELPEVQLLERLVNGSTAAQVEQARRVLATAARAALAQMEQMEQMRSSEKGMAKNGASFDSVAQEYYDVVCEVLQRVAGE